LKLFLHVVYIVEYSRIGFPKMGLFKKWGRAADGSWVGIGVGQPLQSCICASHAAEVDALVLAIILSNF
jgi:hypothetical protein